MLSGPDVEAADHASECKDREQHPGRAANRVFFDRRTVDQQAGERHQRAADRKQPGEQARRGSRPECKAVRAGQIAAMPKLQ